MSPAIRCVLLLALASCASERPYVWVQSLPETPAQQGARIAPGDRIFLLVQGQETMSGELLVREDGSVLQSVLGRLEVAGLTADEATRAVLARLKGVVVEPRVTVAIVGTSVRITVVGEVAHPGPCEIRSTEGVLDALAKAGGLTEFADKDGIFVIRRGATNPRVRFRYSDLVGADAQSLAFRLKDADVLVVE